MVDAKKKGKTTRSSVKKTKKTEKVLSNKNKTLKTKESDNVEAKNVLHDIEEKLNLKKMFDEIYLQAKKLIKFVKTDDFKKRAKTTLKKAKDIPTLAKDIRKKGISFRENFEISENLKQRVIAAAILVPFVIIVLYSSIFLFNGLVLLISALAMLEWNYITKSGKDKKFWLTLGLCYIILPSLFLMTLRDAYNGADIILWMFAIVWGTDTAGYIVGKNLGGPKLAPTISPNKTWSGFLGGVFVSMFIGLIGGIFFEGTIKFFIFFSILLAVIAQMGDLFESKVKRIFGVKDSGSLIPGHGGVLDRIDALLFVAPAVSVIALLAGDKIF